MADARVFYCSETSQAIPSYPGVRLSQLQAMQAPHKLMRAMQHHLFHFTAALETPLL
jgi:hypothetical protein